MQGTSSASQACTSLSLLPHCHASEGPVPAQCLLRSVKQNHYLAAPSRSLEAAIWEPFTRTWSHGCVIILEPHTSAFTSHTTTWTGAASVKVRHCTLVSAEWAELTGDTLPSARICLYKSFSTVPGFRIISDWHNLYSLKDLITHIAHLTFKKAWRKYANGFWLINI